MYLMVQQFKECFVPIAALLALEAALALVLAVVLVLFLPVLLLALGGLQGVAVQLLRLGGGVQGRLPRLRLHRHDLLDVVVFGRGLESVVVGGRGRGSGAGAAVGGFLLPSRLVLGE